MVRIQCVCGFVHQIPAQYVGKTIRCRTCRKSLFVPKVRYQHPPQPQASAGGRRCAGCGKTYSASFAMCLDCGVDLNTGALLYTSMEESPLIEQALLDTDEREVLKVAPSRTPSGNLSLVKLKCGCGEILQVPKRHAGQRVKCRRCRKVLMVPSVSMPAGQAPDASLDDSLRVKGSRPCPGCRKTYPPTFKVCTTCGVEIDSGALLYASMEDSRLVESGEQEPTTGVLGRVLRLLGFSSRKD